MKKYKSQYLVYLVSFITISILVILLVDITETIKELAISTIENKQKEVKKELDLLLNPVIASINTEIEHGKSGFYNNISRKDFDLHFIPFIKNSKLITSVEFASNKKNSEIKLTQKDDSTWINIHSYETDNGVKTEGFEWSFINDKLKLERTWVSKDNHDSSEEIWITEVIDKEGKLNWTEPYELYYNGNPGITLSGEWITENNEEYIMGFDILLTDISKFTSKIKISDNGKVFIFTEDNRVLGLPRDKKFYNEQDLLKYVLKPLNEIGIPVLFVADSIWQKIELKDNSFDFNFENEKWWGAYSEYKLGQNTYQIGIIVPESDFLYAIEHTKRMIIGGFILILIFTIAFVRIYRHVKRMNALLELKNKKIEQQKSIVINQKTNLELKNKEILDSITYAKRIQTAILPTNKLFKEYFKKSFVLFKPKDIVSGDFYWIRSIDSEDSKNYNTILYAAADCTGHGVPGAIVHVVCNHALNRSVDEYNLKDPADILNKTRDIVIQEFEKSDIEVKDGMDIALCVLNGSRLKYAGAFNPLWIIRKGEIVEIKANRQPVGKYQTESSFESHEINLENNDLIYTFSDGLADQFGGEKEKKFGSKRFKELLLSIKDKSMEEQKLIINDTIEKWKGNIGQVDDICVIGIRYINE